MVQAVCRPEDAKTEDSSQWQDSSVIIVSEGTIIKGKEQIFVAKPNKVAKKDTPKHIKEKKISQKNPSSVLVVKSKKPPYKFIPNKQGDRFLSGAGFDLLVLAPVQYNSKSFFIKPESVIPNQVHWVGISLINFYRSFKHSYTSLSQNFQRPPPHS